MTPELREKAKELCGKMSALNRRIEEHELMALKESDENAYRSYKEELEVRSLQDEVDAHEEAQAETDVQNAALALEGKLRHIVHPDSSSRQAAEPEKGLVSSVSSSRQSNSLEDYQNIVSTFTDLIADHIPLIGDCSVLPHRKRTLLYAICWLRDHFQRVGEETQDKRLQQKCSGLVNTFTFLLTHLTDAWHDIGPEDKEAIEKLRGFEQFPQWALPLKAKYINEEKAAEEACEMTFQVMKDKEDQRNGRNPQ